MKIRLGIFYKNLRQEYPRGVARVARSIAQKISENDEFETFAISAPFFDLNTVMVDHFDLKNYLQNVPMNLSSNINEEPFSQHSISRKEFFISQLFFLTQPPWFNIIKSLPVPHTIKEKMRLFYKKIKETSNSEKEENLKVLLYEKRCSPLGPISLEFFDIIISFEAFEEIWGWPVENLSIKTIGFFHDAIPLRINEGPFGNSEHFFKEVGNFSMRANRIICNSRSTEMDLKSFFPVSKGKTLVIPLGHDLNFFQSPVQPFRLNSNTKRILMVGDVDNRKNVKNSFRALAVIKKMLPENMLELIIVGNAAQRKYFESLEKDASRYGNVFWPGYLPDSELKKYYQSSDVFLYPSLWEGFGIPVIEAMTAGVPVVCSDLSSLPEVGGDYVKYCDPYDPESIANAVLEMLSMSPDQKEHWVNAAKSYANNFSWQRSTELLVNAIKDLFISY